MEIVEKLHQTFQAWRDAEQKSLDQTHIHETIIILKSIVRELDFLIYQYVIDQENEAKRRISPTIEQHIAAETWINGTHFHVITRPAKGMGIGYNIFACLSSDDQYRWGVAWTNNPLHLNLMIQALTKPDFSL